MASEKIIHEPQVSSEPRGDSISDKGFNEKGPQSEEIHEVTRNDVHNLAEKLGDRADGLAPQNDLDWVLDKIELLSIEESKAILEKTLENHKWDYNFAETQRDKMTALINGPSDTHQNKDDWELELKSEAAICKYYSPYPEVRAVTTPVDDTSILCETFRAHMLGYIWALVAQFVNSLFNSRFPGITLLPVAAQVLLYPSGKLVDKLPDWGFHFRGKRYTINPGPWTYKEQMLATIIVDVGYTSAYVFWNIQTQTVYYHDKWLTPAYKILLLLSTQTMGLGFAGILRRFVVYPTECFWPSQLATLALNRALLSPEKKEKIHGWTISRYTLFWIVFIGMFLYYWLPGFIFPALSLFPWMTYIAPSNFNLAVITGSQLGLGFNPVSSFDWNVITLYGSFQPLLYPFFSMMQVFAGGVLGMLIIIIMYYTNYKWTSYLPPNSSGIFDNTGVPYNITRVVNNGILDEDEYKAYSPAYYSAGNISSYSFFFAYYPFTMVFIMLDSWRPMARAYKQFGIAIGSHIRQVVRETKNAVAALAHGDVKGAFWHLLSVVNDKTSVYDGFDDPFTNMIRAYEEVPDWWFLSILVVSFVFAIILLTMFQELAAPVWTIFFVIGLNFVFLIPMTYLYAISGMTSGLNVLTELIVGYALPGHPEALMFVKAYGYNINGQADYYTQDQKMGLYAKIPPRAVFRGQLASVIITAFLAYGVVQFVDNDIKGICTPDQPADFNCENGSQVYFSSSVVWGAIGPKRIFEQVYPEMKYAFLGGFLAALVWWGLKHHGGRARSWLKSTLPGFIYSPLNFAILAPIAWFKTVHPSLILLGPLYLGPPQNLTYITGSVYLSALFMYYLRRYKTAWWEKYTYVISAALTAGVALSGLLIFFAVQYKAVTVRWWGTDVDSYGVDGFNGQTTRFPLPASGMFGLTEWY